MDSHNMRMVKDFWTILERDGLAASTEALLRCAHDDVELSPYFAGGRVLQGAEEARDFFRERLDDGSTLRASASSFDEEGEAVIVTGSIRVQRADGSLADAQVRWIYRFSDGRLKRATFAPL
jgi:ketosteroid isomerase-like protein